MRRRRPKTPSEFGYVVTADPTRDPYGHGEWMCESKYSPVGLSANLQHATWFTTEKEAQSLAFWQSGIVCPALRQDGVIRTLSEPTRVKILPRPVEQPTLGFRLL